MRFALQWKNRGVRREINRRAGRVSDRSLQSKTLVTDATGSP
jgi:hypothetical protein